MTTYDHVDGPPSSILKPKNVNNIQPRVNIGSTVIEEFESAAKIAESQSKRQQLPLNNIVKQPLDINYYRAHQPQLPLQQFAPPPQQQFYPGYHVPMHTMYQPPPPF